MKYRKEIIICLLVILSCGCSREPAVTGRIRGDRYINDFFGFQCEIPDGWTVAGDRQMMETADTELRKTMHDDQTRREFVNDQTSLARQLLWIAPGRQADGAVSKILFTAYNVSGFSPQPSAEQFAADCSHQQLYQPVFRSVSEPTKVTIGSVDFFRYSATRTDGVLTSYQAYQIAEYGDTMLIILVSGRNERERDEFLAWTEKIEFERQ